MEVPPCCTWGQGLLFPAVAARASPIAVGWPSLMCAGGRSGPQTRGLTAGQEIRAPGSSRLPGGTTETAAPAPIEDNKGKDPETQSNHSHQATVEDDFEDIQKPVDETASSQEETDNTTQT